MTLMSAIQLVLECATTCCKVNIATAPLHPSLSNRCTASAHYARRVKTL